MGYIEQMFHQVNVPTSDRDAFQFLWTDNVEHPVEDFKVNFHLFGKKDSLCCSQWAFKQTSIHRKLVMQFYSIAMLTNILIYFFQNRKQQILCTKFENCYHHVVSIEQSFYQIVIRFESHFQIAFYHQNQQILTSIKHHLNKLQGFFGTQIKMS